MKEYQSLSEAFFDGEGSENKLIMIGEGRNIRTMTYAQLQKKAKSYAGFFAAKRLAKGKRAVIAVRDLPVFISSFWGSIILGADAIPVIPPQNGIYQEGRQETQRFRHILEIAAPDMIITDHVSAGSIRTIVGGAVAVTEVSDEAVSAFGDFDSFPALRSEDRAVILFTSGSTSLPKGVPVSHGKALAGCKGNIQHFSLNCHSRTLNWLPLEHVGTLMLLHVMPTVLHMEQVQTEPSEILADPKYVLSLMDTYGTNMTFAPNFFCRMLLNQKEEIHGMDISLSGINAFVNGGEMIHYPTASACIEMLGEKGLAADAMKPGWGMTETCNGAVYASSLDSAIFGGRVGVGRPVSGMEVRIVLDGETVTAEDTEGSLQIRGENVFSGYLGESEAEHSERFTSDGWFRTGDIAAIHNGSLIITGRESQIFILNGVNYSITEMEKTISEAAAEKYGDIIIKIMSSFDENSGSDQLYAFIEQTADMVPEEAVSLVRERTAEVYGLHMHHIYTVSSDIFPKTSLGKVDGKALVRNAQNGAYSENSARKQTDPSQLTDEENLILYIWSEALGTDRKQLSPEDDFFSVGGDSAKVPYVLKRINASFDCDINAAQFVRYSTVKKLLGFIHSGSEAPVEADDGEEEIIVL